MVILGAGGFAKELLQVVEQHYPLDSIAFYDDRTPDLPALLFDTYPIIRNKEELKKFFQEFGSQFVIGIGNSKARDTMARMATEQGGELASAIDKNANISTYCTIGEGATILANANISNSAIIGKAPLIYYNVIVTHDCHVGDFAELSPGATLLGHVTVGDYTQIGANATVCPKVTIGNHCFVGAGAVVTKDVPDNTIVVGSPARAVKSNN